MICRPIFNSVRLWKIQIFIREAKLILLLLYFFFFPQLMSRGHGICYTGIALNLQGIFPYMSCTVTSKHVIFRPRGRILKFMNRMIYIKTVAIVNRVAGVNKSISRRTRYNQKFRIFSRKNVRGIL